jgi:hypothetical protein
MATTQKKPARRPRKPARASGSAQGGTRAGKPTTGQRTAKTAGPTKPNSFDDIARQVIADQEAKDRVAGRDDLTPALAKSTNQAKAKRTATKPARPAKAQVNGNGAAFRGRPTTKATAKPKADDKPRSTRGRDRSEWLTGITLQHPWTGKTPDYLRNRVMVIRYQVKADGTVWATLTQLREADGSLVPDFKDYPLDYRPTQERDGRNRPVVLKGDLEGPALREWLLKEGIASPRDLDTNTV